MRFTLLSRLRYAIHTLRGVVLSSLTNRLIVRMIDLLILRLHRSIDYGGSANRSIGCVCRVGCDRRIDRSVHRSVSTHSSPGSRSVYGAVRCRLIQPCSPSGIHAVSHGSRLCRMSGTRRMSLGTVSVYLADIKFSCFIEFFVIVAFRNSHPLCGVLYYFNATQTTMYRIVRSRNVGEKNTCANRVSAPVLSVGT